MKDWIETFVRKVIAWIVFFGEMARRVEQVMTSVAVLEVDLERMLAVARAARNPEMVN